MEKIATRESIQERFSVDVMITNRIMSNLCWRFFQIFFQQEAQAKWQEAHPFTYDNSSCIDYKKFSMDFLDKNFAVFASNERQHWSGWRWNGLHPYWSVETTYAKADSPRWYITTTGRRSAEKVYFMVDRERFPERWWTQRIEEAVGFHCLLAAELILSRLRHNSPSIVTKAQAEQINKTKV